MEYSDDEANSEDSTIPPPGTAPLDPVALVRKVEVRGISSASDSHRNSFSGLEEQNDLKTSGSKGGGGSGGPNSGSYSNSV